MFLFFQLVSKSLLVFSFCSEFEPLHVPNNAPEYVPGNDDVGRRIMFKYTPINSYGKAGETVTVTSDPVKPGKKHLRHRRPSLPFF